MTREKRLAKAKKHLEFQREHLQYWREQYVEMKRDKSFQNMYSIGVNVCLEKEQYILENMAEAKERIAKFERMVK